MACNWLVVPLTVAFSVVTAFAAPTITSVTAQPQSPWNGKVNISYTVSGDVAATAKQNALIASLKVVATDRDANRAYTATSLTGDTSLANGTHSVVWDMTAQGLSLQSANVAFSVYCEMTPATYCVIDLSAGSSASSYPVTYLASPPSGGFNVDAYKTTKLVLKRIEAGSFIMGEDQTVESHRVTLTKPFHIGLFEMTQKQWSLVTGSNPSYFSGDKRPVERVSYNAIRGSTNGAKWPASNAVDSSSFLGKLRARTGLDFDLPTEAQWEYACRAGTTTGYSYGDGANGNYMWYGDNSSDMSHEVGLKSSNPWGLYDIHGNVWEWCLDWWDSSLSGGTDPKGPSSSGSGRVRRGGSYLNPAGSCRSASRGSTGYVPSTEYNNYGFRLAWPLAATSQATTISGSSASIPIPPQYQISVTATGAGTCSFGTQWVNIGATVTATVIPSSSSYRIKLLGDIRNVTLDGTTVTIPATQKRNITVSITDSAEPRTYHVDAANGNDSNDGLSWNTAKKTIPSAIDLAYGGDTILVADGTYSPISARCLDIEIRSVNGAASTLIDGGGTTRCAFLGYYTNDVVKTKLVGFTLRNGSNMHGAGAYGGALEDCVVTGNDTAQDNGTAFCGGGLYNCMATRCVISNNVASRAGGGAWCSELADCLVVGNHVLNNEDGYCGGGTARSRLVRCTVADNTAVPGVSSAGAAGADSCVLQSCIVYGNTCTTGAASDVNKCAATYSCFGSAVSGTGNIAADPLFVDAANGDYRLQAGSPCIDKGSNSGVTWQSLDLDGMHRKIGASVDVGCFEFTTHRMPTTIYVDGTNGNDGNDGLSEGTAKSTIQAAINWSIDGATILVADGVYAPIDARGCGIEIRSANGAASTIIDGGASARCAYLGYATNDIVKTTLVGFTLRNGKADKGGGSKGGILKQCVIEGNASTKVTGNYCGGGAVYGNLFQCIVRNNTSDDDGGGVAGCQIYDCLVYGNHSNNKGGIGGGGAGGGIANSFVVRCTIVGNTAVRDTSDTGPGGAGVCASVLESCIVWGNSYTDGTADDLFKSVATRSCFSVVVSGTGNIVADPLFVDAANGDYRLQAISPCIDAGASESAMSAYDLDGNPRVAGHAVDMGCYEFQLSPETQTTDVPVPYVWLRGYYPHTPNEYDAYESAAKDTAANGVNKVWECYVAGLVPTNATDVFRTVISFADGKPQISWSPRLSAEEEAKRTYTIHGRESLTTGSWEELEVENGKLKVDGYRFFRVKVAMPSH